MNKFEHLSSIDHQVSVARVLGPGVSCLGGPCTVILNASWIMVTRDSPCGQTDMTKNITFTKLRWRAVMMRSQFLCPVGWPTSGPQYCAFESYSPWRNGFESTRSSRVHTGGARWICDKIKEPLCLEKRENFVPIHLYGYLCIVIVNNNTTY